MTAIKINDFGGLAPSVDPRRLPADGAQVARNLDLRFGDFRPARGLGDSIGTVAAGTKSVFITPSGVVLSSTNDVDYVNGQIPDAASERVYLTGRSAYPEAWQSGTYRQLGVPAPTSKPEATVVVVDEFDATDADTAQEAATQAVLDAVAGVDAVAYLGNPAPGELGTPGAFDPLYPKVALHIDFEDYTGSTFKDKSPQQRAITKETGVSQGVDATGPIGAPGANYGVFAGGAGVGGLLFPDINRPGTSADRTWTIDMWLTPSETLVELEVQHWYGAGNDWDNPDMRKVSCRTAGGQWRTLLANSQGSFATVIRCRRAGGANVATAGVPVHIAIQNTGTDTEVYIDGVKAGSAGIHVGLGISHFGRATNLGNEAYLGKADELRVTLAARYTGNFTPSTAPYPTIALPTGAFIAHGDPDYSGLPTSDAADAAYLIELTLSGGQYVAANPADNYLRAMPGTQVTGPASAQYWAVLIPDYLGAGLAATTAAIEAALLAVVDPADPPNLLLTTEQAEDLAPLLGAIYDTTVSPLSDLVAAINSAQAELTATLASASTAATVQTKIALLSAASAAVVAYFAGIESKLRTVLRNNASTLFGDIQSSVVTREEETRGYVITYVTDWDEESAPSPVTELLTLDQNDHVQITAPTPPAGRHIVGWRLYRSSTTDRGAEFQLVTAETAPNAILKDGAFAYFDIGNLSHLDVAKQQELQEALLTLTWVEPPAGLKGLVGLPNGIMAGFVGKVFYLCHPYAPYAWPIEYQQTLEYEIVGLGVFGQTVVILTEGFPYYASGADSASMTAQKIEQPQACLYKRTIATVDGGVMYASPDGLCIASPQGVRVLTEGAFTKEDWLAVVTADAFGAYSDGSYYLFTAGD